jgi:hypothetical protein
MEQYLDFVIDTFKSMTKEIQLSFLILKSMKLLFRIKSLKPGAKHRTPLICCQPPDKLQLYSKPSQCVVTKFWRSRA